MKLQIAQVGKIAYYEFKMHWRERALLVIMLAVGALNIFSILIIASNAIPTGVDLHRALAVVLAAPLGVTLAMLLPIVISDTIPKDTQWGVRELVDTLPISQGVYYAGKVLGMWAAVLAGLVVVAAVTGLLYHFALGAFAIGAYIEMWLVVGVLLVLLNGTLGVIIPSIQPNRRRAVLMMIGVFVLAFFLSMDSLDSPTLLSYLNPIRPSIIMHYSSGLNTNMNVPANAWRNVALTVVAGVAELAGVIALLWGWTRWQGNR